MSLPNYSLAGKVAIVTGSRRGIGKAIALLFAEAGADVVVCDKVVETGELEATANEIKKVGRRSLAIRTDVTIKAEVDNLIQETMDLFGKIDILVNDAAIEIVGKPVFELEEDDWDEVLDTDIKGYYLCAQAAGKVMADQKGGAIVNIASVSGYKGNKGGSAYGVAKAGVILFTKTLAKELAEYNIRVNAIAPAAVRTDMCSWCKDPVRVKQMEGLIPLGHIAEPFEIANVALFLVTEGSGYVTGHTLVTDGGLTA